MKKYLLNGFAFLTMGVAMTSCMKEVNVEVQEQQASLDNAQQTLGFYIPANQDWVMTTTATATFNVKGLSDEATVYVFSNNPYGDGYGSVLASGQTTGTTTTLSDFRIPSYLEGVYVGLKESNGNMVYKYVDVENNQITADYDFSDTENGANVANARTRSMVNEIGDPFPYYSSSEVNAKYKTSAPSNALTWDQAIEAITTHYQWYDDVNYNKLNDLTEFHLTTGSYTINVWYGSRDIYIDGEVSLNTNSNSGMNQARIYLLPGSTLHLNMGSYINDLEIYVANNATLNYNFSMLYKQTGGGIIFNRGTLNLPENFQANQESIIYNEGTINGTNISSAPGDNRPSYFYNFGSLTLSGNFQLNSCASFYNEGTVTVGGLTECTQGNSQIWWINKGHYTTNRFKIQAKNGTYYNYCQLIVENDAYLHDGRFNLMSGGYMEAASADCNNFQVYMGGNTGFNIKGDNYWGAQGDGYYQGFYSSGTNNYVRLGGNTVVAAHKYSLQTAGNITIAFNCFIDLGANNCGVWPTSLLNEGYTLVNFSDLNPTYNSTDCGANWSGNPSVVTPVVENQTWTYAFEDNTTKCDFDMNDVVIQVKENSSNSSKLDVTLVAAGCEYDNYVYLGSTRISWANGAEVHAALGAPSRKMVNTGRGVDLDAVTVTIDKPSANFDFQNADFKIRPFKIGANPDDLSQSVSNDYIGIVKEGNPSGLAQAPLGIAIPAKWKWPKERVNITNAYEGFIAWGKQTSLELKAETGGWYQEPTPGMVYE
ncbi:MAG: DUF4842 domain-containing protein [Prevotella sp.]|nr:DUF4842 domain-containing protein [Prevotella sp.]